MPLTMAANVIEQLANGQRPEVEDLAQAANVLHELFLVAPPLGRSLPEVELANAMGLVNHALKGAVPKLSAAGRLRTLQLASALRLLAATRSLGDPR